MLTHYARPSGSLYPKNKDETGTTAIPLDVRMLAFGLPRHHNQFVSDLSLTRVFEKIRDEGLRKAMLDLWSLISPLPTKYRKRIVLLCRAQEVVINDSSNLLAIQTGLNTPPDTHIGDTYQLVVYRIATYYRDWIVSPIFSSIILDMCRSCPLNHHQIEEQSLLSWGKEISVCERGDRGHHLDFSCWFDPSLCGRPILPGTPPNPWAALRIHQALQSWKQAVSETLLYPRMSRKQISLATVREWERITGRQWVREESNGGVEFTQETLERFYHETGVQIDGPCEIRQKWYKSGLGPRTYFAQGGTSYHKSKHIQEPAGMLTESLASTHPITRLSPGRINLKSNSRYLRIYDLICFTSNHWECKYFVAQLGEWCIGTVVEIVDAVEGRIQVDLGQLILDYNDTMNRFPGYSLERFDPLMIYDEEFHNQAGFLGVYGNINFSTFLHGCCVLMLVQDEDEANVAGDDAHYAETSGYEDVSDKIIMANGIFEESKTFRSDQVGAVCLKRGLIQMGTRILPKPMIIFPSLSALGALFGYDPPQFTDRAKSGSEAVNAVGTEIYRFFRTIYASGVRQDLEIAWELLRVFYESGKLPKHGSLPPYSDNLVPVLPEDPLSLIEISPLRLLLRNHFSVGAVVPKIHQEGDIDESRSPLLVQGSEWTGTMTRKMNYLRVLGYVVAEEQTEVLWGAKAYARIENMYERVGLKIYSFLCIQDVPLHIESI